MEEIDFVKDSRILKALSHPLRLKILGVLSDHEFCVNDLSNSLNISQSISSHHLTILKNKQILHSRKKGSKVYYTIKDDLAKRVMSILRSS